MQPLGHRSPPHGMVCNLHIAHQYSETETDFDLSLYISLLFYFASVLAN